MVWTVVAFDICLYTLGIIGERVRRADEIVLWLRYILSGYIKGLSDINNVLFWGSKEEWLRKINALKYTGKKICFKKVIKRCCGEYAVRNGMYLSGGRQRSPQKYEVWNYIKDAKVAVDYFILLLFSPPTPIFHVSLVILEMLFTSHIWFYWPKYSYIGNSPEKPKTIKLSRLKQ